MYFLLISGVICQSMHVFEYDFEFARVQLRQSDNTCSVV